MGKRRQVQTVLAGALLAGGCASSPAGIAPANVDVLGEAGAAVDWALLDRELLVIGEVHGSEQVPAILGEVVRRARPVRRPLAIGLEAPACLLAELFPTRRIVELAGDRDEGCDRSALGDGRLNRSVVDQVARALGASRLVSLFAIEDARGRAYDDASWDPFAWEKRAADRIAHMARLGRVVVVTGNLHGRKLPYEHEGREVRTLAMHLGDAATAVAVNSAQPGSVYACIDGCKVTEVRATATGDPRTECTDLTRKNGFDCRLIVPRYTPARLLPARG